MLEVWGRLKSGELELIKRYPFTGFSGGPGPKLREGDGQIPKGIYAIEYLNPNSQFHLSMKLDYPNAFDKAKGEYTAKDTKSTNGTWLNGRSLHDPAPLSDGDRIELGASVLEFSSKTFESIEAARAARTDTAYMAPPTLLDDKNRPF